MKQMWNERYKNQDFVYGTEPNGFFKTSIDTLTPGKLLLPAEGEGRNAVYAAGLGWDVVAFDQSTVGRDKALALAKEMNVEIDYRIMDIQEMDFPQASFDAIALTYCHLPEILRQHFHQTLPSYLSPKGKLILEGFSVKNLNINKDNVGSNGPKDSTMLFTIDRINDEFSTLETEYLQEEQVKLNEGIGHQGAASVIRFIGRKQF